MRQLTAPNVQVTGYSLLTRAAVPALPTGPRPPGLRGLRPWQGPVYCVGTPEGYDGHGISAEGSSEGSGDAPDGPTAVLHRRDPAAAMAALFALSAAAFAYVTTENPAALLQPISHGLHSSLVATGRLVTVYAAINVALSAPLAHLTKGLPRKTTMCVLMAALVLTSLAAAAAPGYGWLMAVRVVTALGQALFWSLVIPTAASLFPAGMTGRAVGWVLGGPH